MCLKVELELICEIVPVSSEDLVFSVDIPLFKITDHAGLEIKIIKEKMVAKCKNAVAR